MCSINLGISAELCVYYDLNNIIDKIENVFTFPNQFLNQILSDKNLNEFGVLQKYYRIITKFYATYCLNKSLKFRYTIVI